MAIASRPPNNAPCIYSSNAPPPQTFGISPVTYAGYSTESPSVTLPPSIRSGPGSAVSGSVRSEAGIGLARHLPIASRSVRRDAPPVVERPLPRSGLRSGGGGFPLGPPPVVAPPQPPLPRPGTPTKSARLCSSGAPPTSGAAYANCQHCGNVYMDDSNYCRMCGRLRAGVALPSTGSSRPTTSSLPPAAALLPSAPSPSYKAAPEGLPSAGPIPAAAVGGGASRRRRAGAGRACTVGPIIGLVTDRTARVLCEFDAGGQVSLLIRGEDGDEHRCDRECVRDRPMGFSFSGLKPRRRYEVILPPDIECPVKGQFRTIVGDITREHFNFAVATCNKAHVIREVVNPEEGIWCLWDDLAQRAEAGEVDLILHLGDQIYADEIDEGEEGGELGSCYVSSLLLLHEPGVKWAPNKGALKKRMIEEGRGGELCVNCVDGVVRPFHEWDNFREQILESYRNMYRLTWGYLPCRRALASTSNLMVLDDHDIADDWGDKPCQRSRRPVDPEFWIGCLALQVYHEYQKQLRVDYHGPVPNFVNEGYVQRFGDIGFVFLDMRSPRSFRCPPELLDGDPPLIDEDQFRMLRRAMDDWDDIHHLCLCTPVPPVLYTQQMTQLGAKFINDCEGHIAFNHTYQQRDLLDALSAWKYRKPHRQLSIYTGDIHIGLKTRVYNHDEEMFDQLIASSIGNNGVGLSGQVAMEALGALQVSLHDGWSFEHHQWVYAERNYGLVNVRRFSRHDRATVLNRHVTSDDNFCLKPNERMKFLRSIPGGLGEPGTVTVFGGMYDSLRYTHIEGIGMTVSDACLYAPGDEDEEAAAARSGIIANIASVFTGGRKTPCRGGKPAPGLRPGFRVSTEPADGLVCFDVRRIHQQLGNYICPQVQVGARGPGTDYGLKQGEFFARLLDPHTTPEGPGVAFVVWNQAWDNGTTNLVSSIHELVRKKGEWEVLWAIADVRNTQPIQHNGTHPVPHNGHQPIDRRRGPAPPPPEPSPCASPAPPAVGGSSGRAGVPRSPPSSPKLGSGAGTPTAACGPISADAAKVPPPHSPHWSIRVLSRTCPYCGNVHQDDSNFCVKCGKPRFGPQMPDAATAARTTVVAPPPLPGPPPHAADPLDGSVIIQPGIHRKSEDGRKEYHRSLNAAVDQGERGYTLEGGSGIYALPPPLASPRSGSRAAGADPFLPPGSSGVVADRGAVVPSDLPVRGPIIGERAVSRQELISSGMMGRVESRRCRGAEL